MPAPNKAFSWPLTRPTLSDEYAMDAANKAQMAHQMAAALDARLSTVKTGVGNIDQYKSAPQT
jgi:hypothetical protein